MNADIYIAGDLFDRSREPKWFEIKIKYILNQLNAHLEITAIPGQHDLPNHNIKNILDSSLGIIWQSFSSLNVYEAPLETVCKIKPFIRMTHQLIYKNKKIHDTVKSIKAKKLLKEFTDCEIILSGDNHQTFIEEYEGRFLVNPGSMMRKTAAQYDHEPCFFVYDILTKELEQIFFPIESAEKVMTLGHLEKKEAKDQRLENFIKHVRDGYEITFTLDKNFENYFKKNKTRKSVKEIIMEEL